MKELRAAVAGAGAFGAHHTRKYAEHRNTALIGVFDLDAARAGALAQSHGAAGFTDFDALLERIDLITIAAPAAAHAALALRALEAGVHVLVEKPLAVTNAQAEALIAMAAQQGRILACGHQERAVFEAMGLPALHERPLRLDCVRAGPWSGRGADVSVTLDLLVHDLDLALLVMGEGEVTAARGAARHGPTADEIETVLTFPSGGQAMLSASRCAAERARRMTIAYPSGEVSVDFVARTLVNPAGLPLNAAFLESPAGADPLGANVARFIDCVLGAAKRPLVTGEEAAKVVRLALAIDARAALPSTADL